MTKKGLVSNTTDGNSEGYGLPRRRGHSLTTQLSPELDTLVDRLADILSVDVTNYKGPSLELANLLLLQHVDFLLHHEDIRRILAFRGRLCFGDSSLNTFPCQLLLQATKQVRDLIPGYNMYTFRSEVRLAPKETLRSILLANWRDFMGRGSDAWQVDFKYSQMSWVGELPEIQSIELKRLFD